MGIKAGDHIKTTEEYKKKMYEPLHSEQILDGVVISIDEKEVVTYKLLLSTYNLKNKFSYQGEGWKAYSIRVIGLGWLELKL